VRAALAFLTPLGGARDATPRALAWFPVVGALIGLGVGGAWWAGTEVWNPFVGAALAVAADLALTGLLHVDGLADSADGLLPHLSRERRLEVMRQPDVGAFGVAVVVAVLFVELAAFTSTAPNVALVALLWAITRGLATLVMNETPYARVDGLATAFIDRSWTAYVLTMVAAVAATTIDLWSPFAALAGLFGVAYLAQRRIGGYTGDVLGAAIVVGQTVALLAAAA
jgi:adenosylcobinamide-GDP ribazoletransferase